MKVTVLCGGVGGARFLLGLSEAIGGGNITVVGNVADDLEILGLRVSPDLDTVLYTLTGLSDEQRGWGRADETWNALETVRAVGGEAWFQLGDRDLGLHVARTAMLREGVPLSEATRRIATALRLGLELIPATDDPLRTVVETDAGSFPFQEWFVARQHADAVRDVHFTGAALSRPAPGVLEAISTADLLVITPSNPFVSIWPTLSIPGIREAIAGRAVPCVAVSPLIGGRAVKGPAESMFGTLLGGTTPTHVAQAYEGLIDALVYDEEDGPATLPHEVAPVITRTLMLDRAARLRLAREVISLRAGSPA